MLKCSGGNCLSRVGICHEQMQPWPPCLRVPNADGRERESAAEQPGEARRRHRYRRSLHAACRGARYYHDDAISSRRRSVGRQKDTNVGGWIHAQAGCEVLVLQMSCCLVTHL